MNQEPPSPDVPSHKSPHSVLRRSRVSLQRWSPVLGLGLIIGLQACAPATEAPEGSSEGTSVSLDLSQVELVDLTHPFDAETLYWPTSPSSFELEELAYGDTPGGWFYSANRLSTPEHGGTHLDAPIHFAAGRWTTDEIPLQQLFAPAVVIDVRPQASADPDYLLSLDEVYAWEADHGPIPAGSIVLLHTGWGEYWPDAARYLGDDTAGDASNLHFPSFGLEAAAYLVETRGVQVLGVDTASIDGGQSKDFLVHRLANEANIPGLENVANLDQLPPTGAVACDYQR